MLQADPFAEAINLRRTPEFLNRVVFEQFSKYYGLCQ